MADRRSQNRKDIVGYADKLSVLPGETLDLKVSAYGPEAYDLSWHRIEGAQWTDTGSVPVLRDMPCQPSGPRTSRRHAVPIGSYMKAPLPLSLRRVSCFSVGVLVRPAGPPKPMRTLVCLATGNGLDTLRIGLDDTNRVAVAVGQEMIGTAIGSGLAHDRWTAIVLEVDAGAGSLEVTLQEIGMPTPTVARLVLHAALPRQPFRHVYLAASLSEDGIPVECFSGRLETPVIASCHGTQLAAALIAGPQSVRRLGTARLAHWDFAEAFGSTRVVDRGPSRCDGTLVNGPDRAVTGAFWDGSVFSPQADSGQYGAVHFHDDDLEDCGWPTDAVLTVPDAWPSGLYAARLKTGGGEDLIPFVVRAAPARRKRVAVLLPTYTYLSYANAKSAMRGPDFGIKAYPDEVFLAEHPEFGKSQYDRHADGSPVMVSSRLRPILTMRFGVRPWGLPVDAWLLSWLAHQGIDHDLLTDEDLHRDGSDAIDGYEVVLTGNHPEYYSLEMLDALQAFVERQGRLMYLGGNGFYWRISVADSGTRIEVRRAEDGTRAWIAEPGEAHHAMDGLYGGLWRRLGRAPNRLVGVGFAAQGFDRSGHYRIADNARDGIAGFALEGIEGDTFGDFGWLGDGAAGQEIDRADPRLGTGGDAVVIASSEGHPPSMLRTVEELLSTPMPFEDAKARSDIVLRAVEGGGAVFSVGSMAWIGALAENGYDNPVARMTGNVLHRFLDPRPIDGRS